MMNNNITKWSNSNGDVFEIFNFDNLGRVQTIKTVSGDLWFCLLDICRILEIKNTTQLAARLDSRGVCQTYGLDPNGRSRQMLFVDKGNLFTIISRSEKTSGEKISRLG